MKTAKKVCAMLLTAVMMISICAVGLGETQTDTSATAGIDVVVVLDCTRSMNGTVERNDRNFYRLDAAAMLIGMLDMDGSRVAVVPFALEPFSVIGLTDVSDMSERSKLIKKVYGLRDVKPYTNIGSALMYANQILDSREDKTNRPMIVLLTDGKNDIGTEPVGIKGTYAWENGQIVKKGNISFDTSVADSVTKNAAECSKELGIPIYTIGLNVSPDDRNTDTDMSLREISQSTGVTDGCWQVSAENAYQLPEFFAKVLAEEIGSSVQYTAVPEYVSDVKNGRKQYKVSIPVLNQSVLECNIILPCASGKGKGINPNTIKVVDSTGSVQTSQTGVSVIYNGDGHFAMVKIREPKATGMWTLFFESNEDPSAISFNILYNYDIKLQAQMTTGGQDQVFYKSDKLNLTAQFVDLYGLKSQDSALYQDHTADPGYEPWMTIGCGWKLMAVDANGNLYSEPVRTGTMTADTVRQVYTAEINMKEEPRVASGRYVMVVTAEGAGLSRSVSIPVKLENHIPTARDYSYTVNANSIVSGNESTWTVEGTSGKLPRNAASIVSDADGDTLYFSLVQKDVNQNTVSMSIAEDGTISYTTHLSGEVTDGREKIASGSTTYTLYYDDRDNADGSSNGSVDVTVNVMSGVDGLLAEYTPEMTVTGTFASGSTSELVKNTPVTVTLRLRDSASGYAGANIMDELTGVVTVLDTTSGEYVEMEAVMENVDGTMTLTIPSTGNKAANWNVTAVVAPFEGHQAQLSVPNTYAPEAAATPSKVQIIYCGNDRIPSFLKFMSKHPDTAEDDPVRVIDPGQIFTDRDNDELTYSEPKFFDGATDVTGTSFAAIPQENGTWVIVANTERSSLKETVTGAFNFKQTEEKPAAKAEMSVTATDGDGMQVTYTCKLEVKNEWNRVLKLVILFATLIIVVVAVLLIIRHISKPSFVNTALVIREDPSYYAGDTMEIQKTKKKLTLSKCGVEAEVLENHGIAQEQGQKLILQPMHTKSAVKLIVKKICGSTLELAGVSLKAGKKYTWRKDTELTIISNGDNAVGSVSVKLVNADDGEPDYEDEDEDMADYVEASVLTNSGKSLRRGRQAAPRAKGKKSKSIETYEDSENSDDDFDF